MDKKYHIDKAKGNDTNPGTKDKPWKSIEKLNGVKVGQ